MMFFKKQNNSIQIRFKKSFKSLKRKAFYIIWNFCAHFTEGGWEGAILLSRPVGNFAIDFSKNTV